MKPIVVFDMVGTLLDLSALDPLFQQYFGEARLRREWFAELLQIAIATSAINAYAEFSRVAQAALKVIATRYQRELSEKQRSEILDGLKTLPCFSDVKPGLEILRQRGLQLAVLTNSSLQTAESTLKHAGVKDSFHHIFSADSAHRLKPAPEPYQMVARELNTGISSILMVAAHSWDVAGAHWAGCRTSFIYRPGQVLDEITPTPNFVISNIGELADKLIQKAA
jgi:2-haloacid dehalogenase